METLHLYKLPTLLTFLLVLLCSAAGLEFWVMDDYWFFQSTDLNIIFAQWQRPLLSASVAGMLTHLLFRFHSAGRQWGYSCCTGALSGWVFRLSCLCSFLVFMALAGAPDQQHVDQLFSHPWTYYVVFNVLMFACSLISCLPLFFILSLGLCVFASLDPHLYLLLPFALLQLLVILDLEWHIFRLRKLEEVPAH